jgi:hypothetical protein
MTIVVAFLFTNGVAVASEAHCPTRSIRAGLFC